MYDVISRDGTFNAIRPLLLFKNDKFDTNLHADKLFNIDLILRFQVCLNPGKYSTQLNYNHPQKRMVQQEERSYKNRGGKTQWFLN